MGRRLVVGMLVVLGLLGPATTAAPAPALAATRGPDVFGNLQPGVAFSPNGDGRHDVGRIHFTLTSRAVVTARITLGEGGPLRAFDLGRLEKGRHELAWDGRTGAGRLLPDGTYRLALFANSGAGHDVARLSAVIDTENCGRLTSSRPVVYPRATAVDDVVQLAFVECGWSAFGAEFGELGQARTRMEILDRRGRLVMDEVVSHATTPTLTWDGRREDGHPASEGAYHAWVTTVDDVGNRHQMLTTLRVSHAQLVEETTSFTINAVRAGRYVPEFGGCNGCGDYCGPVTSGRFAGGLSFRPCDSSGPFSLYGSRAYFAAYAPVPVPAPTDLFRITAVGGPTSPGGVDTGRLVVGEQTLTTTPVGDGTTTSPWFAVRLNAYPYLPEAWTPVFWSFGTDEPNSYDVASFTIDYLHYVPAA